MNFSADSDDKYDLMVARSKWGASKNTIIIAKPLQHTLEEEHFTFQSTHRYLESSRGLLLHKFTYLSHFLPHFNHSKHTRVHNILILTTIGHRSYLDCSWNGTNWPFQVSSTPQFVCQNNVQQLPFCWG